MMLHSTFWSVRSRIVGRGSSAYFVSWYSPVSTHSPNSVCGWFESLCGVQFSFLVLILSLIERSSGENGTGSLAFVASGIGICSLLPPRTRRALLCFSVVAWLQPGHFLFVAAHPDPGKKGKEPGSGRSRPLPQRSRKQDGTPAGKNLLGAGGALSALPSQTFDVGCEEKPPDRRSDDGERALVGELDYAPVGQVEPLRSLRGAEVCLGRKKQRIIPPIVRNLKRCE